MKSKKRYLIKTTFLNLFFAAVFSLGILCSIETTVSSSDINGFISLGDYATFLNQVAVDDPYGLYNEQMADGFEGGAIIRKGEPGNYNYHVVGNENLPISNVSYLDILRYCNWVENGGGTTFDNPQITEEGSYQIGVPQVERARVRAETEATRQQPLFQENPDSTFVVVDLNYPDQDFSEELALDPNNLYATSNQPSRYLVVAREDLGALPQSMATRQAIQPQQVGLGQGMGGVLLGVGMIRGGGEGKMEAIPEEEEFEEEFEEGIEATKEPDHSHHLIEAQERIIKG